MGIAEALSDLAYLIGLFGTMASTLVFLRYSAGVHFQAKPRDERLETRVVFAWVASVVIFWVMDWLSWQMAFEG